jgi:hypothetical protein
MNEWKYLSTGEYPPVYKHVLITVLNDEGIRTVVSGFYVRKSVNKKQTTKLVTYWCYDAEDVFITSGKPGECSKPIAWMEYPQPAGAEERG